MTTEITAAGGAVPKAMQPADARIAALERTYSEILRQMEAQMKALEEMRGDVRKAVAAGRKNEKEIRSFQNDMSILPAEADDISKAVKRKGVEVLGGRNAAAYKNIPLRRNVYRDIYGEIKRNFGLINERGAQESYKKLRRKYFSGALDIVADYVPPISIANDITAENDIDDDE